MAITYTPLDISKSGGGEVFNGQSSGPKEVEPIGSSITIEQVSGESTIPSVISPFIEKLPGQFPMTQEFHGAGLRKSENISFPERQEIILPLTPRQTIDLSNGEAGESKTWLVALSDRIRKIMDFRKKVQTA